MDSENTGIPATMLVGPASVGNGNPYPVYMGGGNSGMGNGWGDGSWIILLIIVLLAAGGGWGNNGGFGGQPIIVNDGGSSSVQRGFDQAAVMAGIGSVQSGVQNLATQLCGCCGDMQMSLANGFASTTAAITGAQNSLSQQLYSNELASLNRSFAEQTANTAGFTGVQTGLADLKYTVASEACADRAAVTQGIQTVLDKLCSLELDNYRRENDQLRTQLNMANLAASQTRQTTDIQNSIINELRSCPIPAMPVYGSQPIFTCPNNNSGCGCGGSF